MNISNEERQAMIKERQQDMIEACNGKNEGDACTMESRMREMEGTCKIMEENLICMMDMPDRSMGPR